MSVAGEAGVVSAVPTFAASGVAATARWKSVAGRPFVGTSLTQRPYGDWKFEVLDPTGYRLVFGGAR